jgi:thiol:disulfide interchange protein
MGFTLLAAAVWLYGVLLNQVTQDAANWFLAFLLLLGVCLWAIDRFAPPHFSVKRRLTVWLIVALVLISGGRSMIELEPAAAATKEVAADAPIIKNGKINWAGFSPDRVKIAGKRSRPVFIDYTADWCANCKTQEKLVLETKDVRAALEKSGILPMKADLTNQDDTIWEWLEKQGRSGIPAYAVYLPDGSVDLLPEVITKSMVIESLGKAAKKYPKEKYLSVAKACLGPDTAVTAKKKADAKSTQ